MDRVYHFLETISKGLAAVAAAALAFMMCLTVVDVVGRATNRPLTAPTKLWA
jgi:TRAP-type C4-dicarboxylate transport system permease small subunit